MLRFAFFFLALTITSLFALPGGHKAIHGKVEVTTSGKELHIKSGKHAVIHWDKFSIGKGETARFQMKNSKSSVLNRVTSGDRSDIFGKLESNGSIYLLNSKGILIGPDAQINVNALVASTLDVLDEEFLRGGEIRFFGDEKSSIINMGKIEGNTVYLLASNIENHGTIKAEHVGLATGSKILLRPEGEQRIFIEASNAEESIDNRGKIEALTTEIKNESPYVLAVRTSGSVEASSVEKRDGKIFLVADKGTLEVDGLLQASHIEASGKEVYLFDKAHVEAPEGKVFIGGDPQNLTEGMIASDLTVLYADSIINVSASDEGDAGDVYIYSDKLAAHYGKIYARGGQSGGDGGFVELSGKEHLGFEGIVDCGADAGKPGTLYLDPKFADVGGGVTPLPATSWTFASSPGSSFSIPAPLGAGSVSTALKTSAVIIECNTDCTFSGAVAPDTGSNPLTVNTGRSCIFTGAGSVTLLGATGVMTIKINDENAIGANRDAGVARFRMASGSSITTATGAVMQSVGTFGAVQEGRVTFTGATISSSGGSITLEGVQDLTPAVADNNYGISLVSSSSITTTGSGAISLTGTGAGGAGGSNHGVNIESSSLGVATGALTVTGTAIATGSTNQGININTLSALSATGSGTISITGTGGNGVAQNYGVFIQGTSTVTVDAGLLSIMGTGGSGLGADNEGVRFSRATLTSSASTGSPGGITILGNGGTGTNFARGVHLVSLADVLSDAGPIMITGNGGVATTGRENIGVEIGNFSTVISTSGDITITGGGGDGTLLNDGITHRGVVESEFGDILLTGTGGGTTINNHGILQFGTITSTGALKASASTITLMGTGGPGSSGSDGMECRNGTTTSVAGNILLDGDAGTGGGSDGISLINFTMDSTGTGTDAADITFIGDGSTTGSGNGVAVILGSIVSVVDGNISITGTGISSGTVGSTVQASTVESTGTGTIDIMGTAVGNNGVTVLQTNALITSSSGKITINGTGDGSNTRGVSVSLSGSIEGTSSAEVEITGVGGVSQGEGVEVGGAGSNISTEAGTLTITGTGGGGGSLGVGVIALALGNISTTSGTMNVTGNAGAGAGTNYGIGVDAGTVTSATGILNLDGEGFGSSFRNFGIQVAAGGVISISSSGTATLNGQGSTLGTFDSVGVNVTGAGSAISNQSGTINVNGTGGGTTFSNHGVAVRASGEIIDNSGTVRITGIAGNALFDNNGIRVSGGNVETDTGTMTLNGTGRGSSFLNHGISLSSSATVTSTDTGTLSLTGLGSNGTTTNHGISLSASTVSNVNGMTTFVGTGGAAASNTSGIFSTNSSIDSTGTGAISLTGTTNGTGTICRGIYLEAGAQVDSLGTGGVTLQGTGGIASGSSYGVQLTGSTTHVQSASGLIDITAIAGGATEEGMLVTSSAQVISNTAAAINVTTMSDLDIDSGGQIIGGGGVITVDVDRDLNITGSAPLTGIFPKTGGVTIKTGRDANLTGTATGSAQIGNADVAGTTSNITLSTIGRNLVVDGGSLSGAADSGYAVIGHGQTGATNTGNILLDVIGSVTVLGANAGAGSNGFGQIGHLSFTGETLNGNINVNALGSVTVTGGTGATADARIGHGGPVASVTTQSRMSVIANNNITVTSPGAAQGIVSNPSSVFSQGELTLVIDNANPVFPNFGAAIFTLGVGSDLTTTNGELRVYTVQPSQNVVNAPINGVAYVPTAFNVDNATNQYNTYFPGGSFVAGSAFRVHYKVGAGVVAALDRIFCEDCFYFLQSALGELQDRLPLFRHMRLPTASGNPWHHPSICGSKRACDPGFDPYHSFIFEDDTFWVGELSSDVP